MRRRAAALAAELGRLVRAQQVASVDQDLLAEEELAGYEVFQRFYEIGSPAGLSDTRAHFMKKESPS